MRRSPPELLGAEVGFPALRRPVARHGVGRLGRAWGVVPPVLALLPAAAAWAQSDTLPRAIAIQPSAAVTQTFSDNIHLAPANPQAGAITQLSAGVGLRARSGLVQGFLDYSLSQYLYSGGQQNNAQNALNANIVTQLVDGRAKLGLTASIARSAVSAFGAQPGLGGGNQANTTELRNVRVAPSFRGPIGPSLRYNGELSYALTDASKTQIGDSSAMSAAVHVEPTEGARLSWGLDASRQRSTFKLGRTTTDDRLNGNAVMRLDDLDLQLQAGGGIEFTDLSTLQRTSYRTWGAGATWTPSPRTRVVAQYDHRFYGPSHSLTFEHRTALTTWRLTDSRSLSTSGDQSASGGQGTAYDLFYSQFASAVPDPVKRQDFVNAFLNNLGISPGQAVGFLRSAVSLQDMQEASVAWRDVRSAAVLSITRTAAQRLSTFSGLVGDLSNSSTVRQHGVSVNLSHRLTPMSTVNLLLTEQRGLGELVSQRSQQRQFSVQFTTRPAVDSTLAIGMRRALYDAFQSAYSESAVFATYGIRF